MHLEKRSIGIILLALLLAACSPGTSAPPASTATRTAPPLALTPTPPSPTVQPPPTASPTPAYPAALEPQDIPWERNRQATSAGFSPDGTLLAIGSLERITLLSSRDLSLVGQVELQAGSLFVTALAFSPDGRYLASANGWGLAESEVSLWSLPGLTLVRTFTGNRDGIQDLAFSPDGKWLASASQALTVIIWKVADAAQVRSFSFVRGVSSVAFSPDGRYLAAGEYQGMLWIWQTADLNTPPVNLQLPGGSLLFTEVGFSSNGGLLAGAGGEAIRLWEVDTWKPFADIPIADSWALALSQDLPLLVGAGMDQFPYVEVVRYDQEQTLARQFLPSRARKPSELNLSPDNSLILAIAEDGRPLLWKMSLPADLASTCPAGWPRLAPDEQARVTPGEQGNRVRSAPELGDNIVAHIYEGTVVQVLEGPICSNGLVFWKVESDLIPGGRGWTAEGDGRQYWLEPYRP